MRRVSKDTGSTGVCAKASLTRMALVEKSTAPMSVIRKPARVSLCFTSGKLENKKPRRAGLSGEAADGTRTHDLLHGKQTL